MKITVKLYGGLRDLVEAEKKGLTTLDLPPKSDVQTVLDQLGITYHVLFAVNDDQESAEYILQDGDKLTIFEAMAGG